MSRTIHLLPMFVVLVLVAAILTSADASAGSPGWRGWLQANASGFGRPGNTAVGTLAAFDSRLYAGTWNEAEGAELWRSSNGTGWTQFTPSWGASNLEASSLVAFGGKLYAGTSNADGAEIWRSDGANWNKVVTGGFGDLNNYTICAMAPFGGSLYAATGNMVTGLEIWRSSTGDSGGWTRANSDGFGHGATWTDCTLDSFGSYLYAGISRSLPAYGGMGELWRTANGSSWSPVFADGLGDAGNTAVSAMAVFEGAFYIGMRNNSTGGEVWRSTNGSTWTPVFEGGLGDPANTRPYGLIVDDDTLILIFSNAATGANVWHSPDGAHWQTIAESGWGGANVFADYFDKGAAIFRDSLYVGTVNEETGGQIWQRLHVANLPLGRR